MHEITLESRPGLPDGDKAMEGLWKRVLRTLRRPNLATDRASFAFPLDMAIYGTVGGTVEADRSSAQSIVYALRTQIR